MHQGRPFFKDLVEFMISGPVMIQVLEGESAIQKNRELMGATDPKKADKGTIRADFAQSIDANAVHGSDAAETAAVEIAYFFPSKPGLLALAEARQRDDATHEPSRLHARGRSPRGSPPRARSRFARARCSTGSTSAACPTSAG